MIVVCTHCNTKFNLPDDKVKPGGVKIRCTRCKNIFEVSPPQAAPSPEESLSDGMDQGLSDFDLDKDDLSTGDAGGSDFGTDMDQDAGGDDFNLDAGESDFNLDSDLDTGAPEESGEAGLDASDFDLDNEVEGISDEGDSVTFDLDEKKGPDAAGGQPPDSGLGGDTDISFDEAPETASGSVEPDTGGDIDLSVFDDVKEAPPARAPAPAAAARPAMTGGIGDDFGVGGGDLGFGGPVDIGMDDTGLGDIAEPVPTQRPKKKAKRTSPLMVALLIILFLAAGGYYVYSTYFAEGFDPAQLLSLFSGKEDPLGNFENVENKMEYYYVENREVGKILILQGTIINHADVPKGRIKVRVSLYDKTGKTLATSESYCGNILDITELETLPKKEISRLLLVQTGKAFDNALIKPKGSIPYMLAVFSVPQETDGYNITIVEAQIVGK
jgi:predicted Zn finger-like uncharacterized protein